MDKNMETLNLIFLLHHLCDSHCRQELLGALFDTSARHCLCVVPLFQLILQRYSRSGLNCTLKRFKVQQSSPILLCFILHQE